MTRKVISIIGVIEHQPQIQTPRPTRIPSTHAATSLLVLWGKGLKKMKNILNRGTQAAPVSPQVQERDHSASRASRGPEEIHPEDMRGKNSIYALDILLVVIMQPKLAICRLRISTLDWDLFEMKLAISLWYKMFCRKQAWFPSKVMDLHAGLAPLTINPWVSNRKEVCLHLYALS